ncbi:MAG: phosphoribosylanthranilate isomerase [Anaerolineae bacterium]|nr:phosphoribosylanthranilate isomerase [Candidatus Roseilinea sp.]MDW8451319.1 phosphoribosylanthranilate isomerase [Anaerolineae bacterium]
MTIVKICGITNLDDALCAIDAGADLLGFIFYAKSPRAVTPDAAREIVAGIRGWHAKVERLGLGSGELGVKCVGVFVNESPAHMLRVLDDVGLDYAQLSGDESPDDLAAMGGRAYKAIRAWSDACAAFAQVPLTTRHLPDLLLDANHATLYGGSGQRADESLATRLARRYRLLLAGGLTPDNVADAIRTIRPWGVDVASGVEASPGKKDHAKVRAFIAAAKAALRVE